LGVPVAEHVRNCCGGGPFWLQTAPPSFGGACFGGGGVAIDKDIGAGGGTGAGAVVTAIRKASDGPATSVECNDAQSPPSQHPDEEADSPELSCSPRKCSDGPCLAGSSLFVSSLYTGGGAFDFGGPGGGPSCTSTECGEPSGCVVSGGGGVVKGKLFAAGGSGGGGGGGLRGGGRGGSTGSSPFGSICASDIAGAKLDGAVVVVGKSMVPHGLPTLNG